MLITTRTPAPIVARQIQQLGAALSPALEALGLRALDVARVGQRVHAFAGEAPNSADITVTATDDHGAQIQIDAYDADGRVLAAMITAAVEHMQPAQSIPSM